MAEALRRNLNQGQTQRGGQGSTVGLSSAQAGTIGGGQGQASGFQKGGGWTNIQDYLKANAGNTGTADYIKRDVVGGLDTESKGFEQKAQQYGADIGKSTGVLDKGKTAEQDLSRMAQEAGQAQGTASGMKKAYGSSADDWAQSMKAITGGTYGGPQTADYSVSGQTQGLVKAAKENPQALLNQVYQKAGVSGPGMFALQSNLDAGNVATQGALEQAKTAAGQFETRLKGFSDQTNQQIADAKARWANEPQVLKQKLAEIQAGETAKLNAEVARKNAEIAAAPVADPMVRRISGYTGPDSDLQNFELRQADYMTPVSRIGADYSNISAGNEVADNAKDILNMLGLAGVGGGGYAFSGQGPRAAGYTNYDQARYEQDWQNILAGLYEPAGPATGLNQTIAPSAPAQSDVSTRGNNVFTWD